MKPLSEAYDFTGRTIVMTGGTGVLGREMAKTLASSGANVALLSRDPSKSAPLMDELAKEKGMCVILKADVLNKNELESAAKEIVQKFRTIDCLVNGAGGNSPKATTNNDQSFFQIQENDLKYVAELNLLGTILPSQVFGKLMAEKKEGVILNITSVNA